MNSELLLSQFHRVSDAPDAIPRLRRFILDLAVRGKLVEQDSTDEPASELLRRIQEEKTRLSQTGEIKEQRPMAPVEADEAPFDVPSGWKWTRIRQVSSDRGQKVPDRLFTYIDVTAIDKEAGCVADARVLTPGEAPSRARKVVQKGDVLYSCVRPYLLNVAVIETEIVPAPIASTAFAILNGFGLVLAKYLWITLRSPFMVACVEAKMRGQAYPAINDSDFANIPLPLPPLAEQHRMAAKVDELMALCDRVEASQNEREERRDRLTAASLHHLDSRVDGEALREHAKFYLNHLPKLTLRPDQVSFLRQTILHLAVRGKLVPQDPNDEAASELLKHIRMEKQRSLNSGKRQKQPTLSSVDPAQAPFHIPEGWAWGRFPELGTFGRGKSKHRPRNDPSLFDGGTHLFVQTGDVGRSQGLVKTHTALYNDLGLAQSLKWPKGTLCITIAANIADSGILGFDACFPDSVVGFVPSPPIPDARYFEYFIRTAKANLLQFAPATAQKNINLEILNAVLIPLPPLSEQHRIVAKVDELMALCQKLERKLTATQTERSFLLESIVYHALNGTQGATATALFESAGRVPAANISS